MRPTVPPRLLRPSDFGESEEDYTTTLDNIFSSQRPLFSLGEKIWTPPTDVFEIGATLHIKMEIAGVSEDELDIAVDKNLLRVSGARCEGLPAGAKATYHLMEVRHGSFERVFGLPHRLDLDAITATYRDGFLLIEIPRQESERREIPIEVD